MPDLKPETGHASLRELREQLDALAPCPDPDRATIAGLSRHHAAEAMIQEARFELSMHRPGGVPDPFLVPAITGNFAAARLAQALANATSQEFADDVAREIRDACEMGETGEWSGDFLGADASEVGRLAGEIATAIAAIESARPVSA